MNQKSQKKKIKRLIQSISRRETPKRAEIALLDLRRVNLHLRINSCSTGLYREKERSKASFMQLWKKDMIRIFFRMLNRLHMGVRMNPSIHRRERPLCQSY